MNKGIWILFVIFAGFLFAEFLLGSRQFMMALSAGLLILIGIGYVVKLKR